MATTELDRLKESMLELEQKFQDLNNRVGNGTVRVGTILPYGGELISKDGQEANPEAKIQIHQQILEQQGWFLCDGRQLNRGEYEDLYHIISANFGAPDSEHFNLPDLRGRFARGVDHIIHSDLIQMRDPNRDSRVASAAGGNSGPLVGSVQEDELKSHKHKIYGWHGTESGNRKVQSFDYFTRTDRYGDEPYNSGGGSETRPKNIYVHWIIYAGVKKANI